MFAGIEKTLKSVENPQRTTSAAKSEVAALPQKPVEPVKLPDVAQITAGMSREDLLVKFGSPSQKMTIPEDSHLTERFRYDVDKETVRVLLEDGKVTEVVAIHLDPLPRTN